MKIPLFAKLILVTLIIGTGAVLSSGWKEMERSKRIEAEVQSLRQEAERIRGENQTIEEKISFFSSDSFAERAAKEKLGMKKKDEEAVVLDTGTVSGSDSSGSDSSGGKAVGNSADTPNYRKWAVYFGIAGKR